MRPGSAFWLQPDWNVDAGVRALSTTVAIGNLAPHAGSEPNAAMTNRAALAKATGMPAPPRWLNQVHGSAVVRADDVCDVVNADAVWTESANVVCAIVTADCLPVLFSTRDGSRIAAAHAGWRGLCAGVLERTMQQLHAAGVEPADIAVWLGPAISARAYEVDARVRDAFAVRGGADCGGAFTQSRAGHWNFDLYAAARTILGTGGITHISGGEYCTYSDTRFFSYRRDPACGRQATLIWRTARLDLPGSAAARS